MAATLSTSLPEMFPSPALLGSRVSRGRGPALARILVATAFAAIAAPQATPLLADAARPAPAWPAWPYPAPHDFAAPCLAGGICARAPAHEGWRERRERFEALRREPAAPAAPGFDLWDNAGSPWGYVRRLPPPTPESEIQPRYRGASQVRPEFSGAGSARGQAPEGR
jgi:hypothetical protein